jgi:hypothetical protein
MTDRPDDRLRGLTEAERQIMNSLLRQPPEEHKAAPKPSSPQGLAQRQRRQKEKEAAAMASRGA